LAEDSIDNRVNNVYNKYTGQGSVNPQHTKADSIDDVVEKPKNKKTTLGTIVKDLFAITPIAAVCAALVGPAAFLTPIGLSIGGYIADKKAGRKTPWSVTRKRIGIGFPGAVLAYWAYSIPDMISNTTFLGKITKTLFFNPIMVAPWIFWYKTTDYVLQKYGFWKGFVFSMFNFKVFKYMKEAYKNVIKGKFKDTVKETFMTLAPIHFFSMNYVADPFYRLAIGTGNDILFAMIAGEQAGKCILSKDVDSYPSRIELLPCFNEKMFLAQEFLYSLDNKSLNEIGEILEKAGGDLFYLKNFSAIPNFLAKPNLRKNIFKLLKLILIYRNYARSKR